MKREDLEALGLSKEQVDKVLDMHHEEIDPVQDELKQTKDNLEKEQGTVKSQNTTITDLKKDLEEFKDADVSGMKQKIANLEKDIKDKDDAHAKAIADRDFNNLLKSSISDAKGLNTKAITALLDLDTLKASKNQKEDIAAAIKSLSEAEDSKMLFGEGKPNVVNNGNTIGDVGGSQLTQEEKEEADCRAAMGLPPTKGEGDK